jgi:AraC family transcriptional regulator of adaptative response/methylated-DNA-[protein]-cysteine methyltransferase
MEGKGEIMRIAMAGFTSEEERWDAVARRDGAADGVFYARLIPGDLDFQRTLAQVVSFVEMPRMGLDLPFDVRGTAFQQRVWQALRAIPAGSRATYGEIAERIGAPKAVRAVAQACAANALAVAIPCHRVVRQDGALAGYRWGVERKRALLERETAVSLGER